MVRLNFGFAMACGECTGLSSDEAYDSGSEMDPILSLLSDDDLECRKGGIGDFFSSGMLVSDGGPPILDILRLSLGFAGEGDRLLLSLSDM